MDIKYPISGEEVAKLAGCWDVYMASQQQDILNELTPQNLLHGTFPTKALPTTRSIIPLAASTVASSATAMSTERTGRC